VTRKPSIELIPEGCVSSAEGEKYRYFARGAVMRVTRSLEVDRINYGEDQPSWMRVDPLDINFDPHRVRTQVAELTRRSRKGQPLPRVQQRLLRDLTWLLQRIDPFVLRVASRVPQESARPWALVVYAMRILGFSQLLSTAPALAVLLVDGAVNRCETAQDLEARLSAVTSRRLRDVCQVAGAPSSALAGFRKVTPAACSPALLRTVAERLKADSSLLKIWAHLPAIGPSTLEILAREELRRLVSPSFLHHLAHSDRVSVTPSTADALEDLRSWWEVGAGAIRRTVLSTPAQLRALWNSLFDKISPADFMALCAESYPVGPAAEIDGMVTQIRTGRQLALEGLRMKHCVFHPVIARELRRGESFVYHAEGWGLEPCTIELRPIERYDPEELPAYQITQIAGIRDARVSSRTLHALRIWAEDQGLFMRESHAPEVLQLNLFAEER